MYLEFPCCSSDISCGSRKVGPSPTLLYIYVYLFIMPYLITRFTSIFSDNTFARLHISHQTLQATFQAWLTFHCTKNSFPWYNLITKKVNNCKHTRGQNMTTSKKNQVLLLSSTKERHFPMIGCSLELQWAWPLVKPSLFPRFHSFH